MYLFFLKANFSVSFTNMSPEEGHNVFRVLSICSQLKLSPFKEANGKLVKNSFKSRNILAWLTNVLLFFNGVFFLLKGRNQLLTHQTNRALLSTFLSVTSGECLLVIKSLENSVDKFIQVANELQTFDSKLDKLATRKKEYTKWGSLLFKCYLFTILVVGFGCSFQCVLFAKDSWNEPLITVIYGLVMLLLNAISCSHFAAQTVTFVSSIQTINFWLRVAW